MRVLLVAEHASELFGGEAIIPFQYFKQFRLLGVDAHLLVHERTAQELRLAFPEDIHRIHFVRDSFINISCSKLSRFLPPRLALFTLGAISHFDTQLRERRIARSLIQDYSLDVVHEPIPVSPKLPSLMYGLDAPVIIGPMNGGMDYPPPYAAAASYLERLIFGLLRLASTAVNFIIPGKRRAALLLVANARTLKALPGFLKQKNVLEVVENGVDLDRFQIASDRSPHKHLQIIYLGRLVDWKYVDLLLDACGRLIGGVDFELHIVGDGPLRASLEEKAKNLSLTNCIRFHGWLSQHSAAQVLRNSDVLVLPSMRECGGAVVLEAMASGIPVIATAWGGPVDYITPETGILIAPAPPVEFAGQIANAILWLSQRPQARAEMGRKARERVRQYFDWRVKAETLLRIYSSLPTGAGTQRQL